MVDRVIWDFLDDFKTETTKTKNPKQIKSLIRGV